MVVLDREGLHSRQLMEGSRPALCVFEYIYFARPDSNLDGKNVHLVRRELGRRLADECQVEADLVTGVPDSSISAASGYAERAACPTNGLIKNRYIGRVLSDRPGNAGTGADIKLNTVQKIVRIKGDHC